MWISRTDSPTVRIVGGGEVEDAAGRTGKGSQMIALNDDGDFTVARGNYVDALTFDPAQNGEMGAWILCSGRTGVVTSFHVISTHTDLDEALCRLAGTSEFTVRLTSDVSFRRPGNVRAVDVLRSLDFIVCRALYVFGTIPGEPTEDREEVIKRVHMHLFDTQAFVVDAQYVGTPERNWFFKGRIVLEGVFNYEELKERALSEVRDKGLDISPIVDVEEVPTSPNEVGKVYNIFAGAA